jgi:hypothetical protein
MVSFVAVEPLEAFTDGCAPLICVGVSQTRRQFDKKKSRRKLEIKENTSQGVNYLISG